MSHIAAFTDFNLDSSLLETLKKKGFHSPTPIQSLAIPALLCGQHDLIARAETGTGKTAAYGIPVIETLHNSKGSRKPRALVLAPTRELAMQISGELSSLCNDPPLKFVSVYGGQAIEIQLNLLRHGADVVIGTPGRILDLIKRNALKLEELQFAILDEADEMLDMGFIEDIEDILSETPENKRMLMFSATMPEPIREIAQKFMVNPEFVSTPLVRLDSGKTEQIAYEVRRENKLPALERILAVAADPYAMIFCRTRADVDELTMQLQQLGFPAEALHGDLAQAQRTRVIANFKSRRFKIMIATDVAARGLDVNDLTHVINFSLPQSPEIYVHRIGRTGRAGKSGIAITFYTPGEKRRLEVIRKEVQSTIRTEKLPDAQAIVKMKKERFLDELDKLAGEQISFGCLSFAKELLNMDADPEELIAALLQMRYGDELDSNSYPELSGKRSRQQGKGFITVGVGKKDGYTPGKLMNMLYEKSRVWKSKMGKIVINSKSSTVELPASSIPAALRALKQAGISAEAIDAESSKIMSNCHKRCY